MAFIGLGNIKPASILLRIHLEEIKMMLKWFFMAFLALFIVACGNKGALYIPDENSQIESLSSSN